MEEQVRQLWEQHRRTPFPDCRGVVVDGVDLVVANADLDGCLRHFLVGSRSGSDDLQLLILREVAEALARVVPRLAPGPASSYFDLDLDLDLAAATLRYLQQLPTC